MNQFKKWLIGILIGVGLGLTACQGNPTKPATAVSLTPASAVETETVSELPAAKASTLATTAPLTATAPLSRTQTPLPTQTAVNHTPQPAPSPSATPVAITEAAVTPSATPRQYATLDAAYPTPATAVPTPVPVFSKPAHIINIILLGNDVATPQGGRTDSLILISIDKQNKTATMLSLPRDLFVYIPGWQMTRINLALPHGHGSSYGGGELIKDTVEYNLGIAVDYYARIGFNGFKEAVDAVEGIEMIVNCPLTDWRLILPELDPSVEENWEQFTLEPGVQAMDGDLALWYARSRRSTNDFERGLRQQRVLQALLKKGLALEMVPRLPDLWAAYQHNIETDLSLPVMLELAALAPAIEQNGVQHLTLPYEAFRSWRDPASGGSVQLLQWAAAAPVLQQVMMPPTLNRATRPGITVEVLTSDFILYRQMADNLSWYGLVPRYTVVTDSPPLKTRIEYFGPNRKGSFDWLVSWLFQQTPVEIVDSEEETVDVDYRVTLGLDANPCLSYLTGPES